MPRSCRLPIVAFAILACIPAPAAEEAKKPEPKKPRVEILEPKDGTALNGPVTICVKAIPGDKEQVKEPLYAGLGGPPWSRMERVEDTDEWQCTMDSTLVPNGGHVLEVKTGHKRIKTAITISVENPLKVFFADLHSHTSNSDGTLVPTVAHDYARNVAKLDVFSLTDHLEQVDELEWSDMREAAWKANDDGVFVVLPGLEWTKKTGHTCIYDPKTLAWPEDTSAFYKAAADAGVVVKFNHCGDGSKVFDGMAYSEVGDQAVQLIEVRSDTEERGWIRALNNGWHIAPDGSDDTHSPNWGNAGRWTGIVAPGLSRRNVWHALKNRRCYATLDRNCRLQYTLNGAPMGTILEEPVQEVDVNVQVTDPDTGDVIAKVEFVQDGAVIRSIEPNQAACWWQVTFTPEPGSHYFYVRAVQADGNKLWAAPVWVEVADSQPGSTQPSS